MKKHEGFAVPYRFRGRTVAGGKGLKGEIPAVGDVVRVFLKCRPAICGPAAPLLLDEVVGEIGDQALGSVALFVIRKDAVPPPVVEDFMGRGGMRDEGKTDGIAHS